MRSLPIDLTGRKRGVKEEAEFYTRDLWGYMVVDLNAVENAVDDLLSRFM